MDVANRDVSEKSFAATKTRESSRAQRTVKANYSSLLNYFAGRVIVRSLRPFNCSGIC